VQYFFFAHKDNSKEARISQVEQNGAPAVPVYACGEKL